MESSLKDPIKWLFVIVKLSGYVEGSTRLQKLSFLAYQRIDDLKPHFYADWVASKYGPMSFELDSDLKEHKDLIPIYPVKNDSGHFVNNFMLSKEAEGVANQTILSNQKITKKIDEIVKQYAKTPLMSLLYDVYYQYPKYAKESVIKPQVMSSHSNEDSPLNPAYDQSEE